MIVPNRYIDEPLVVYPDGKACKGYRDTFVSGLSSSQVTTYTVVDGDTLQLIATKLYGYPELWFLIADINPSITFNDDISVGDIISVPSQGLAARYTRQ